MIQCVCDRCKKVIHGTTMYHVSISATDIDPLAGESSATTAMRNLSSAFSNALKRKKDYCEECIKELERFLEGGYRSEEEE